jgi:threonine dehydratase
MDQFIAAARMKQCGSGVGERRLTALRRRWLDWRRAPFENGAALKPARDESVARHEGNPLPVQSVVRPTTLIEAPRLADRLGARVVIASEASQHTGSFKFRAGYNVAASVPHRRIIAASSGNFGAGLACACQMLDKACTIVMPDTSATMKIDAVRRYGATVDVIDVNKISRQARVRELGQLHPDAYLASPFDDPLVIEGNATLGAELANLHRNFDLVVAAVGGGGLMSGLIRGFEKVPQRRATQFIGVEPIIANDLSRSLKAGHIVANETEPQTIADGVRTLSVGQHNWAVLHHGLSEVIEVAEEQIEEGVRLLFHLAHLKAEPTGALGIAALLAAPERFRGHSVCCVVSGGNVDDECFAAILAKK